MTKKFQKFHALLLRICPAMACIFLFLSINPSAWGQKLEEYLSSPPKNEAPEKINTIKDLEKNNRKLRSEKKEQETSDSAKEIRKTYAPLQSNLLADLAQEGKLRERSFTIKQMGAWSSISLRGRQDEQTLVLPLRPDEVVVKARLHIAYDYSPSLVPDLSQLRINFNGRLIAAETLPQGRGQGNTREIEIDPRIFKDINYLQFMFTGQLPGICVDPLHPALWLVVSELGRLELTLAHVPQATLLSSLPMPFFDTRQITPMSVPFVFSSAPTAATLQAAGTIASWFGMQARNRTVQFPAHLDKLPSGNVVLMLLNGQSVEGIKGLPHSSVSFVAHPRDEFSKILLVTGSSEEELARAAQAIALNSPVLNGTAATVPQSTLPAPRKPYDAPAWIPTDRVVHLGELMRGEDMQVRAYYPDAIRLNFRLPPDIFAWRTSGTPLELKYRGTNLSTHTDSSLNVSLNSNFIAALPLNGTASQVKDDHLENRNASLHLPPYASVGRDQLQFHFKFDVHKKGTCQDLPPLNLEGAIDPRSTLDFSNFPHYAALPNLASFASLGYPYTRIADLAETAVVLSDKPTTEELSLYLSLMGRMGESTGYPALRHQVVSTQEIEKAAKHDLIIIGSGNNSSLMTQWKDYLPLAMADGERVLRESRTSWRSIYRWAEKDLIPRPEPTGKMNLSGLPSLASIMAFESPLQATRSVVFFYADQSSDLRKITDAITDFNKIPQIQGDFVTIDDKLISFAQVAETYFLGNLTIIERSRWLLNSQPLLLAGLILLLCVALSAIFYRRLRGIFTKFPNKDNLA